MYTKIQFGKDLKEKIQNKDSLLNIADWAYTIYLDQQVEGFDELLIDLTAMELGSEFALTYEKLNQIADDLIMGKDVKL